MADHFNHFGSSDILQKTRNSLNHVLMIFSEIAHKCNSLNYLLILNRTNGIWSGSDNTT